VLPRRRGGRRLGRPRRGSRGGSQVVIGRSRARRETDLTAMAWAGPAGANSLKVSPRIRARSSPHCLNTAAMGPRSGRQRRRGVSSSCIASTAGIRSCRVAPGWLECTCSVGSCRMTANPQRRRLVRVSATPLDPLDRRGVSTPESDSTQGFPRDQCLMIWAPGCR